MIFLAWLLALTLAVTPLYSVRLNLGPLPFYLPEIVIVLAFAWWLGLLLTGRTRPRLPALGVTIPTLVFLGGATLSAVHAGGESLGALKSWVLFPALFGGLVFQLLHSTPSRRRTLEVGLVVATWLVVAVGLVGLLGHGGRLSGLFNSPNSAAMWLVPTFYLLLSRRREPVVFVTLLASVVALLLTRSLSGLIAWLVAGIVFFAITRLRSVIAKQLGASAAILLVAAFSLGSLSTGIAEFLGRVFGPRLGGRLQIWAVARHGISEGGWLGLGPGSFQRFYFARIGLLFPNPIEWSVPEPHSLYLATWLSSGLIGFIGFFGLVIALLWRQFGRAQAATAAALSAILVHGLTDTTYWKNDLAIIFFLVVALTALTDSLEPTA